MIDRSQKQLRVRGGRGSGEISDLVVDFVIPGAGAFGRDKHVSVDEATAATASYQRDGAAVRDQSMSVSEALALVERAEADAASEQARRAAAGQAQQARAAEVQRLLSEFSCPVCRGRSFDEHLSREDSQWGLTTFRMRLLVCRECSFVSQFALGRSLFVPS